MKTITKSIIAVIFVLTAVNAYAQSCCSAATGKDRTICCPGGQVTLQGGGACGCTDTLIVGNDTTILHCNTILYSWAPAATLNNPNIQNPIASPSVTTTYTLTTYCYDTLNHDTCCQASATETVVVNSSCCRQGASSQINESGINMFPNPAGEKVTIELNQEIADGEILIYDNLGRMVRSQKLKGANGLISIDLSGIAKGTYLLQVKDGDELTYSNNLIIE